MHSDEENGSEEEEGEAVSEREMLRLKTPSVGKLFNYLRYCGGVERPEIRRGTVTPWKRRGEEEGVEGEREAGLLERGGGDAGENCWWLNRF